MTPAQQQTIDELSLHAWPLADSTDSILSRRLMPPDFTDYLTRKRFFCPPINLLPDTKTEAQFAPFGWNDEAISINNNHARPSAHPPLDVVKRVNSRPFSAHLERVLWGDDTTINICRSEEEIQRVLAGVRGTFLLKSRHGNSALGNRRVLANALSETDRRWITACLLADEDLSVEIWRERVADISSTFQLRANGSVDNFATHEVINTTDGAFIGSLFENSSTICGAWIDELRTSSAQVGAELHKQGYFGPVCIDSFVWLDKGTERLRRLVDLNARLHVSVGAERLWQRLPRSRVALWRFYNLRKLNIPEDYREFEILFGKKDYDPESYSGILLTSPLRFENRKPAKLAMLFLGRSREEVLATDLEFRHRFDKTI